MPIIKLTTAQAERFKKLYEVDSGDVEIDEFFDVLYEAFIDEMPYGVAKARDGDPYNWLADRLDRVGVEICDE